MESGIGSQELEPGTQRVEPGTANLEPGTRHVARGTRNFEPELPEPGTRNFEPELPEPGTRNPEPGTAVCSSTSQNLVNPRVARQGVAQALDQRRAVSVQEVDEPDLALLWLSAGERLSLRVMELAPQRVVLALGGLNDLRLQFPEIVLHPRERGACGALERRIERAHRPDERLHL